ncbi:MAG: Crp/Fnr family transcriptional regulator [Rhodospirillales bacterium]|jgi:CRP/FNR family transcriptional regulator|nr:Crp/Fnr family transcriptional regulator [Rhodospirillales bacterium]
MEAQKDCFQCAAEEHTEWCDLSEAELAEVRAAVICRRVEAGTTVYHEGTPSLGVHYLSEGLIGIRKVDRDGNAIMLHLVAGGESFGYRSFLAGEDHTTTAECLEPGIVCFVERSVVSRMIEKNPALGLRFLRRAVTDLEQIEEKRIHCQTLSVRARLAHLLLVLRKRFATAMPDGEQLFDLPVSRKDMAAMIGARPETVSRIIREMEDDGVAQFAKRQVRVPEIKELFHEIELGYHV